jgi:hypothetical protein
MSRKWFEVSTSHMNAHFGQHIISVISNAVRHALKWQADTLKYFCSKFRY